MEMMDMMTDLINTKASLDIANGMVDSLNKQVRKLNRKCMRKNLLILGLVWFGVTASKMLGESDKKLQAAENEARGAKAELAHMQLSYDQLFKETQSPREADICCDGKATITKKDA